MQGLNTAVSVDELLIKLEPPAFLSSHSSTYVHAMSVPEENLRDHEKERSSKQRNAINFLKIIDFLCDQVFMIDVLYES